jgi:hypothetical protein
MVKEYTDCTSGETVGGKSAVSSNTIIAEGGIMNTPQFRPLITFNQAQNEHVINHDDSYIVLGSDRPSIEGSGYGGKGLISDTIDLVVGRVASANGGEGPCSGLTVNNSFSADAARIYISQMTDIDANFGISTDTPLKKRSAIGMKADGIRLVGRSGVKIVTGGMSGQKGYSTTGETDSQGNKLDVAPTIELIAGNAAENLQPIAKGRNTRNALKELSDILEELMGQVYMMSVVQMSWMATMGAVCSPLTFGASAAASAAWVPIQANFVVNPCYQTRISKTMWEYQFLHPRGGGYVCSKNVKTT